MSLTLKKCSKEGCNPVEQTRGNMKPEDHHQQFKRHDAAVAFMEEHGVSMPVQKFHADAHDVEDMGSEHASDIRISCSKCGKATGWDRKDTEEFKRHADADHRRVTIAVDGNKDAVRARWNEMVK